MGRILSVILIQSILSSISAFLDSDSSTRIVSDIVKELDVGSIRGNIEEYNGHFAEVYHSIPYAEPPVGERRFEVPEPVQKWNSVRDTRTATHCVQFAYGDDSQTSHRASEDCLHLKVVVPLTDKQERYAEKLPVLFWVHGGSYQALGKAVYNTSGIVSMISSRKIIFVSVAYRLGIYGFMSLLDPDFHGNYGLEDVLEGARFLKRNIGAFGGDDKRITMAGESAGAAISSILANYEREDLFSGVMLFSGSSQSGWAIRNEVTKTHSRYLIKKCRCERRTVKEMKRCMQHVSLKTIHRIGEKLTENSSGNRQNYYELYRMGCTSFTPVVDSYRGSASLIDRPPMELIRAHAHLPVFISTTAHERWMATAELVKEEYGKYGGTVRSFLPIIFPENQETADMIMDAIVDEYFDSNYISDNHTFTNQLSHSQSAELFADAHQEALLYAEKGVPVYYHKSDIFNGTAATTHGVDVCLLFDSYVWGTKASNWRTETYYGQWRQYDRFAHTLAEIVEEFVKTGRLSKYPRFTKEKRLAIKTTVTGTEIVDADTKEYNFWMNLRPEKLQLRKSSPNSIYIILAVLAVGVVSSVIVSIIVIRRLRHGRSTTKPVEPEHV